MVRDLAKLIGQSARTARAALGLNQAEAAERVGISTEFYARIERGKTMHSVPTLAKLAEALEVTVDKFFAHSSPAVSTTEPHQSVGNARTKTQHDSPELSRLIRRLRAARPKTVHLLALLTAALDHRTKVRTTEQRRERGRTR